MEPIQIDFFHLKLDNVGIIPIGRLITGKVRRFQVEASHLERLSMYIIGDYCNIRLHPIQDSRLAQDRRPL